VRKPRIHGPKSSSSDVNSKRMKAFLQQVLDQQVSAIDRALLVGKLRVV
jgi:hypothetical protein